MSRIRLSEITHAASTFVFIEPFELQGTIYPPPRYVPGSASVDMSSAPGQNHWLGGANGATLGFADGHAIFWQYACRATYNLPAGAPPSKSPMGWDDGGSINCADSYQLAAWSGIIYPRGAIP